MLKTAVVILNWNGKKFLEQFIPTVLEYSQTTDTKVFVADNGSTDESVKYLKNHFPQVSVVLLDKNYGFSEGYNRALQQIEAKYYILLNSDVEVTPNWVSPVISYMEKNPDTGACMPKIKSWHDKKIFEYAGAAGGFIDKFGYPFCRGRIISEIEQDNNQYEQISEIFWASGACMFIRADVYWECGGLDNDFFAHMEEIDLCWRIKSAGHKIMYIPEVQVYHVGGGTLPNNSAGKIYLNYRNNLFLLYKNLPSKNLWITIGSRMLLDFCSAFIYILQGKFAFYRSVIKAHWHFMFSIKKMKPKRKELQEKTKNTNPSQIYPKSIVFDFFVKKKKIFSQYSSL